VTPLVHFLARPRTLPWRLGVAIACIAIALGLRVVGVMTFGAYAPFAFQLPAVIIVTLLCGLRIGLLSVLLMVAGNAVLLPLVVTPTGGVVAPETYGGLIRHPGSIVLLGSLALNGIILAAIAGVFRSTLRELHKTRESLSRAALDRETTLGTLEALLAHSPLGTAFFDRDHRFVRVNAHVAQLNGLSVEEHRGRKLKDLAPDYADAVSRLIDRVFATGDVITDVELGGETPAAPGVMRHWITGFFPVRDSSGAVILAGVAVVDITERKKVERELAESAARLRDLAEAVPQMVWTADAAGRGDYYNARWGEYTGTLPCGSSGAEWDAFVHPDDHEAALGQWRQSLQAGETFGREYRLKAADGSYRWFLCRAVPVRNAAGVVERWFGSCTDISEIMRARETLARSREDLEQLVVRRTSELLEANSRLKAEIQERERAEDQLRQAQKMEAVGQLTGGVAHDFNNLLTVIIGNLEAAERRIPVTEGEIRAYLDHCRQGALRAATLTQRLLAFSRRQPLDPKPTDVNRLVTGMSELLRRSLGERVQVETVLSGGLWTTEVDPNQLENAILNLAVNARDAMPDGGKLTIETANAHLDETYADSHGEVSAGQYVVICVSDTGSGMSLEVCDKAFEPFFTTKGPGEGTGLGLSQVYGFVKQSGGHVKIYSEIGLGSTLKIYLPRRMTADSIVPDPARTAPHPLAQEGGGILVVEDEASVRRYSVRSLTELGYKVVEADSGEAALALLEAGERPLLLFTDVNLGGGINGQELAERARALQPDLRVLFTTAYARNAIVHHGRLDAGVKLLTKPFNQGELAGKVRDVLEQPQPLGRVLLVEDEPFVAMVARQIFEDEGFDVVVAGSAALALSQAEASEALALAVVDLGLPDMRGDELVKRMRVLRPQLPIIIASGYGTGELEAIFADQGNLMLIGKPYDSAALQKALRDLGFTLAS